jgi:hypothetical protein
MCEEHADKLYEAGLNCAIKLHCAASDWLCCEYDCVEEVTTYVKLTVKVKPLS